MGQEMYWYLQDQKKTRFSRSICILVVIQFLIGSAISQEPRINIKETTLGKYLQSSTTFQADFYQELFDSHDQLILNSKGSVSIFRPNKFLWNYIQPAEQVLLADGKSVWFYDKELKQVTVMPQDNKYLSTPAFFLSNFSINEDIFQVSKIFTEEGIEWFQIDLNSQYEDIKFFVIGFEGDSISNISFTNSLDQETQISFFNTKTNLSFSEDVFKFQLPEGVDLIGSL
ncbi:MAG: outer membrane lipoprotein carrier protein LolA [Gammaproteobacteria bacterium]|nr:outer membrane lipoprotein carrier protein LolA [Gammaproteobacteria bacterium]